MEALQSHSGPLFYLLLNLPYFDMAARALTVNPKFQATRKKECGKCKKCPNPSSLSIFLRGFPETSPNKFHLYFLSQISVIWLYLGYTSIGEVELLLLLFFHKVRSQTE